MGVIELVRYIAALCVTAVVTTASPLVGSARGDSAPGISVQGSQLLEDGHAFRFHGFNMVGVLTPQWCSSNPGVAARNHWGAAELTALIGKWHANSLRLQISQEGLGDTANHSQADIDSYLQQVENAVALARSYGLVVILSLQDQSLGCGDAHQLPNAATVQAWSTLAPAFADDPYVVYEMFNEPGNAYSSSAQWAQWNGGGDSPLCNGGTAGAACSTAVGFQQLVSDIRGWGANNVLLADGANQAEHFNAVSPYLLTDTSPGRGIAYAIHPYYYAPSAKWSKDMAYYQSAYGFLVDSGYAVVATEWNYLAKQCRTRDKTLAPRYLAWLEAKGIGMTAMAGDYPGRTIADWNWTPTECGTTVGGSGKAMQDWFSHLSQSGL